MFLSLLKLYLSHTWGVSSVCQPLLSSRNTNPDICNNTSASPSWEWSSLLLGSLFDSMCYSLLLKKILSFRKYVKQFNNVYVSIHKCSWSFHFFPPPFSLIINAPLSLSFSLWLSLPLSKTHARTTETKLFQRFGLFQHVPHPRLLEEISTDAATFYCFPLFPSHFLTLSF